MTAPSYTTDLLDVTTAESTTSWLEMSGHTGGGAATQESDYFIQGQYCVSQSTGNKTGTQCGLEFDYGSNISINTGDCFFFWLMWLAPNAVDTFANGGLRAAIGSSSGNVYFWKAGGVDFSRFPYGGWQNIAIDPTFTADYTDGSPVSGNYRIFGSLPNLISSVSKGNPHGVDAIRYGRGELKIEYGDLTNGYGTFAGLAQANDYNDATNGYHRWGLFQKQAGAYLWKGLLSFGNATNACDFRDSNRAIFIDDTPRTYATFNKIEVNNVSSRIDWTNISFTAVNPSQLSRGRLAVIDDADLNLEGCLFVSMDTFSFKSNSSVLNSTFQGCNEITSGGGTFTGTKLLSPTVAADSYSLGWNVASDPDGYLDNMTFEKGSNAHHAIAFGTSSPLSMTLRGMTFSGFNSSNGQNDSVLHILRTTGTVNIAAVGCSGTISYKTAGATVNVTQGALLSVTVKDIDTSAVIQGARVLVKVTDGSNFPYQDSVSITGSGTTATVTHTAHGLSTGDHIIISGANEDVYNGVYQITVTGADNYTYTTNETIGTSPATGTITATMALISGTTDSNGKITDQRPYSVNQPISGWVRNASSSPYYRQQAISDTVDSSTGKDITLLLSKDE